MIDPQQHGHYHREGNQEFSPGKPQDEHARQQGQEQDGNAEPEKDAYWNVHVCDRSAYIDLIKAYAICRTADYIQYEWDKCFHYFTKEPFICFCNIRQLITCFLSWQS